MFSVDGNVTVGKGGMSRVVTCGMRCNRAEGDQHGSRTRLPLHETVVNKALRKLRIVEQPSGAGYTLEERLPRFGRELCNPPYVVVPVYRAAVVDNAVAVD